LVYLLNLWQDQQLLFNYFTQHHDNVSRQIETDHRCVFCTSIECVWHLAQGCSIGARGTCACVRDTGAAIMCQCLFRDKDFCGERQRTGKLSSVFTCGLPIGYWKIFKSTGRFILNFQPPYWLTLAELHGYSAKDIQGLLTTEDTPFIFSCQASNVFLNSHRLITYQGQKRQISSSPLWFFKGCCTRTATKGDMVLEYIMMVIVINI